MQSLYRLSRTREHVSLQRKETKMIEAEKGCHKPEGGSQFHTSQVTQCFKYTSKRGQVRYTFSVL